jgi:hypothetical protein
MQSSLGGNFMVNHSWFKDTMKKKEPFKPGTPVNDIDVAHLLLGIANSDLAPEMLDVIDKEKMIHVVNSLWDEVESLRSMMKKQLY